jgi:hypothetical protein
MFSVKVRRFPLNGAPERLLHSERFAKDNRFSLTAVKSFIGLAPCGKCYKTFFNVIIFTNGVTSVKIEGKYTACGVNYD